MAQDIDFILDELVGGGHWWQWRTVLLLFPVFWVGGYPLYIHMFAAYEPPHRCWIAACDDGSLDPSDDSHFNFTLPIETSTRNLFAISNRHSSCLAHQQLGNACIASEFDQNANVTCDKYVFKTDVFTSTLATELNLVCDQEFKRRLLGSLMMLGFLVGSFFGGRLGDRFGRKKVLFGTAALTVPTVAAGGFLATYEGYAICRFISAAFMPIIWMTGTSYGIEIFSPRNRSLFASVKNFPVPVFVLSMIVHLTRDRMGMHLWTSVAIALSLPAFFFVPESPRWLIAQGRKDEAVDIFLSMARANRRHLTKEQTRTLSAIVDGLQIASQADTNLWPKDMFRRHLAAKSIIVVFVWVVVCISFYALMFNAVKLHGDPIENFVLSGASEMPVSLVLWLTLDRIGRKGTLILSNVVLGLSCITLAFVPKMYTWAVLAVYLVGKCCSRISMNVVWTYTNEIYPTNLRNQAVGLCSTVSRVFGFGASFVGALSTYWQPLPMLVLGLPVLLSAGLILGLQETSGRFLPQTMNDALQQDPSQIKQSDRAEETSMLQDVKSSA